MRSAATVVGFPLCDTMTSRDITADSLKAVRPSVSIEHALQPLTGEQLQLLTANTEDEAWADISAQGFWGNKQQRAFLMYRCSTLLHQAAANPP